MNYFVYDLILDFVVRNCLHLAIPSQEHLMADKVRESQQYLRQKAKYIGLGNADTTRDELAINMRRDTLASLAMHKDFLLYNSVATKTHPELYRQNLLKEMATPLNREKTDS